MRNTSFGEGLFFAFAAFFLWGVFPLYWKLLSAADPLHILAFRILLSLALVSVILLAAKKTNSKLSRVSGDVNRMSPRSGDTNSKLSRVSGDTAWLEIFKQPKKAALLVLASWLLCCNWGLYIWAVNQGRTIETSLGYYINPLVSIVLGLVFFRERLRPLQWVAVAVAFAGVLILTALSGVPPWISLGLAFTFGFYGLLKKKLSLSALESLGAETLAAAPVGLLLLCFSFTGAGGAPSFSGFQGLAYLPSLPVHTLVLFALCGAATMLPLYCFARGAKLLPLSTIGFTQFVAPTIQFAVGLFVFGEAFSTKYFIAFLFIWTAVIIYIISLNVAGK